ncbi:MAG: hypothetical protein OEW15_16500 [Nitrospirota bacterium]|nr:hypothetical protein [Nitrospirota bacterium]
MRLQNQHIARSFAGLAVCCVLALTAAASDASALTITPNTWNVIGLDSNTPALGPNRYPVGARICGTAGDYIKATFNWDAGGTDSGTYINLRSGSLATMSVPLGTDGCGYAYFEVEVARTAAAFDMARRYHISAERCTAVVSGSCTATDGSTLVSTPQPRELYVEHLVSQARNGIDDVKLGGVSIPAGGSMNLTVGNTYVITLVGHTAPGGYNQFEEFINIPNTIFRVNTVSTTYTANTSPYVSNPNPGLYADACGWENDPNSPYYLSCVGGDYKTGDVITTEYSVTILSGGGTSQTLGSLLYDLSGASFHYNADYSTGFRIANIIDPTSVAFAKTFTPNPTNAGGISTLSFTLTNPNAGIVSGLTFTDPLPGGLAVATPPNASTSGCGSATFAPSAGATTIAFSDGAIAANSSCVARVDVTTPALGLYSNTTSSLYVGTVNTGKVATATLTVDDIIPTPPPVCGLVMAQWTFTGATAPGPAPSSQASDVTTATASLFVGATGGTESIDAATGSPAIPSWQGGKFQKAVTLAAPPTSATAPYFELAVDASKYTNVSITLNDYASASWGASNAIFLWTSANGGPYTATTPSMGVLLKTTWTTTQTFASASTGTAATMTFRIGAAGSTNDNGTMNLDDITITGCAVPKPPTITKAFAPNPVGVNGASTLTFTVTNPNANIPLSGIRFSDTLVSGLTVTTGSSTQCGGTLAKTAPDIISFTNGALAGGASCTITATITATAAGPHQNVSGLIYSTQTGTNASADGAAKATLTALLPPVISKQFGPNPILTNGVSQITFLVTNPNQNDVLSNVAFTDTFPTTPGAMVVAGTPGASTSNCGAPTFAPAAGAGSVSFSNGTIPAGGTCAVTVNVTAPVQSQPATVQSRTATSLTLASVYTGSTATNLTISKNVTSAVTGTVSVTNGSATVTGYGTDFVTDLSVGENIYIGTYRNVTSAVTATVAGGTNRAADTLTVSEAHPSIALFKEVATTDLASTLWRYYLVVNTGDPVYYQFTVQNFGDVPLTEVTVTDADLPSPLTMAGCQWYYGYDFTDRTAGNLISTPTFTLDVANNANNRDSATCVLGPVSAATGTYLNNASADGIYNTIHYTDSDWAMYATTGLTLAKTSTETLFTKATDTLHYSYTVTNSGSAVLAGPVTVSDVVTSSTPTAAVTVTCPAVSTVGDFDNYLDPGESVTCTSTYIVTVADVTAKLVRNSATASTTAASGIPAAAAPAAGRTVLLAPDLTAAKTNNVGGITTPGATFTWTVTVSNPATAGTATFTSGQTLLTDNMPVSGATYTAPAAATTAGGTVGAVSCSLLASALSCTASGAVTLPPGGSFSIPVSVTSTTSGTLANPTGGVCRADPGAVLAEIDETNNDCSDTVTVRALPSLTIVKSASVVSDPFGGSAIIPGSIMQYAIIVTNTGAGYVDDGATLVTDAIPANVTMYVDTSSGDPVAFSCSGAPPCGLTFSYATDVKYTDQSPVPASPGAGCSNYTYAPSGVYDANVKGLCVNPKSSFQGSNANFTIFFRVRVN